MVWGTYLPPQRWFCEFGAPLPLMDMMNIFMSRTFLAQFGLILIFFIVYKGNSSLLRLSVILMIIFRWDSFCSKLYCFLIDWSWSTVSWSSESWFFFCCFPFHVHYSSKSISRIVCVPSHLVSSQKIRIATEWTVDGAAASSTWSITLVTEGETFAVPPPTLNIKDYKLGTSRKTKIQFVLRQSRKSVWLGWSKAQTQF